MTSTPRFSGLVLALCLTACASAPTSRPMALPLTARPALTPVAPGAVQCLSKGAYTTIVNRERALRTWGESLEAIIQANNAKAKQ